MNQDENSSRNRGESSHWRPDDFLIPSAMAFAIAISFVSHFRDWANSTLKRLRSEQPGSIQQPAPAKLKPGHPSIHQFVRLCVHVDPRGKVTRHELLRAYRHWCERMGIMPGKAKQLVQAIRELGPTEHKTNGVRMWLGVRLVDPPSRAGRSWPWISRDPAPE